MNATNKEMADDYFQRKAEVQELSKKAQAKSAEAGDLERQINGVKADINALQVKLQTADRDMHWGNLSHDDVLQLKREMAEKTEGLKGLTEALTEKNEAVAVFQSNLNRARRPIVNIKKQIASAMVDQFASEVVELAGDSLKNLVNALVVSKGIDSGYSIEQKNRYRQNLYIAITEAILETVSENNGALSIPVPGLAQASQQIEDLIVQMAEAQPVLTSLA